MKGRAKMTAEVAEGLAIQALSYLANDPGRFAGFLAETGIGPREIRAAAREPQFLAGVLDYLAAEEALLLAFAAEAGVDPAAVQLARAALGGPGWERDTP